MGTNGTVLALPLAVPLMVEGSFIFLAGSLAESGSTSELYSSESGIFGHLYNTEYANIIFFYLIYNLLLYILNLSWQPDGSIMLFVMFHRWGDGGTPQNVVHPILNICPHPNLEIFRRIVFFISFNCKNPGQGKAELSSLGGITIAKSRHTTTTTPLPPHHYPMFLYNLELLHTMSTIA